MTSFVASIIAVAGFGLALAAHGEGKQSESAQAKAHWLVFAKRADQLLTPLAVPRALSAPSWQTSIGFRAGFYDSLLGYAHYLQQLGYDADSFRALTDSLMADDLDLAKGQVPEFLTAFFAIASKVPSHNQRLQNLVVWFGHKLFAPYQGAIKLRLYKLYRARQRLDLFPGKPLTLLLAALPHPEGAPEEFNRRSRRIHEQIAADAARSKRGLWAKAAFCAGLKTAKSACLSHALIESLKIDRKRWVKKISEQRATALASEPISAALTIKVIHWLTYRGLYRAAADEFNALDQGRELPLNLLQLRLFLLVKTGDFERFDALATKVDALLGKEAATWRQQLAAIDSFSDLKLSSEELFAAGLDRYSFDPILPWHQRFKAHLHTATELKSFGQSMTQLSRWQRLSLRRQASPNGGITGLQRDADMVVVGSLLDDMSSAIVKGTLAEQRRYQSQMTPRDRARLLQACRLILEQDSHFSRYADAAGLLKASERIASHSDHSPLGAWRRDWLGYLKSTSGAALAGKWPRSLLTSSERGFLSEDTFHQVAVIQQVIADRRDGDRRAILWRQLLTRQRSLAHHATRIQLILEPYRDALGPALDSAFYDQKQHWHRIGTVLSKTYERTKGAIKREQHSVAERQSYIIKQTDAMAAWQSSLSNQEAKLWQAFQQAQPNLIQRFDTMILRQRKLLAKWQADRLAGRYLEVAGLGEDRHNAEDKLATLSSSLKTLKLATWLDWPLITRQ